MCRRASKPTSKPNGEGEGQRDRGIEGEGERERENLNKVIQTSGFHYIPSQYLLSKTTYNYKCDNIYMLKIISNIL